MICSSPWLGFLGLFAAVTRTDVVDPRVAQPERRGAAPCPVGFADLGFDHWQIIPQVGA